MSSKDQLIREPVESIVKTVAPQIWIVTTSPTMMDCKVAWKDVIAIVDSGVGRNG
jgi:hypothetical protein